MGRAAKVVGTIAFLLTELAALFAAFLVSSIRCCSTAQPGGPAGPLEWASVVVFALVMLVPAAMIGLGSAMIVAGIQRGIATITRRR